MLSTFLREDLSKISLLILVEIFDYQSPKLKAVFYNQRRFYKEKIKDQHRLLQ